MQALVYQSFYVESPDLLILSPDGRRRGWAGAQSRRRFSPSCLDY